MASIITNPLFRKFLASLVTLAIGFYIGYRLNQNQLKEQRKQKNITIGKYKQLVSEKQDLINWRDTLQRVVIHLAMQERIQVDNHIKDTKVKDGSSIHFVPRTKAQIIATKIEPIQILKDSITASESINLSKEEKQKKQRSWISRTFRKIFIKKENRK